MNPLILRIERAEGVDDEDGEFWMHDLRKWIKASSATLLAVFNGDLGFRRNSGRGCFNGARHFIILPDSWYRLLLLSLCHDLQFCWIFHLECKFLLFFIFHKYKHKLTNFDLMTRRRGDGWPCPTEDESGRQLIDFGILL